MMKNKSILSFVASVCLLSCSVLSAGTYSGGDGTAIAPYEIDNLNDLIELGDTPTDWSMHFILTNNIEMSTLTGTDYKMIGTDYSSSFKGVFDGNNNTISNFSYADPNTTKVGLFGIATGEDTVIKNLTIENVNIEMGAGCTLIGSLCGSFSGGIVSNCKVINVNLNGGPDGHSIGGLIGNVGGGYAVIENCSVQGTVQGRFWVGGLIGDTYFCTVRNCNFQGDIPNFISNSRGGLVGRNYGRSVLENCYALANVSGASYIGGLVGDNQDGIIINCYADCDVTSTGYYAGGLVGRNWFRYSESKIIRSYSKGLVQTSGTNYHSYYGGFIGYNDYEQGGAVISDCYSEAQVQGNAYNVGGFCGYNNSAGQITNCYSTGQAVGNSSVGGFCGYNNGQINDSFWDTVTSGNPTSSGGTAKNTSQMYEQATFTNWDFVGETTNGTDNIWRLCVDGVDYPKLSWQFSAADFVCPDSVDLTDFAFFAAHWLIDCELYDCSRVDMNKSGDVNIDDLLEFVSYWLED